MCVIRFVADPIGIDQKAFNECAIRVVHGPVLFLGLLRLASTKTTRQSVQELAIYLKTRTHKGRVATGTAAEWAPRVQFIDLLLKKD